MKPFTKQILDRILFNPESRIIVVAKTFRICRWAFDELEKDLLELNLQHRKVGDLWTLTVGESHVMFFAIGVDNNNLSCLRGLRGDSIIDLDGCLKDSETFKVVGAPLLSATNDKLKFRIALYKKLDFLSPPDYARVDK